MKPPQDGAGAFTGTLLTASIVLANIDMHGTLDYALKATIGGAIWLAYKIAADWYDRYRKGQEVGKQ